MDDIGNCEYPWKLRVSYTGNGAGNGYEFMVMVIM
jgi:hypothetical protein